MNGSDYAMHSSTFEIHRNAIGGKTREFLRFSYLCIKSTQT